MHGGLKSEKSFEELIEDITIFSYMCYNFNFLVFASCDCFSAINIWYQPCILKNVLLPFFNYFNELRLLKTKRLLFHIIIAVPLAALC